MIINFKYDNEKDLRNYELNFLNTNFPDYGRDVEGVKKNMVKYLTPSFVKEISDEKLTEKQKLEAIAVYLDKFEKKNKLFIEKSLDSINTLWQEREKEYFDRLKEFFGKEAPFKEATAYYTTLTICPYNYKAHYFYLSIWNNLATQLADICHEVMHLYFLNNFESYCREKGLDEIETFTLNEALTVILNFKFMDILVTHAVNGKPATLDLQNHIAGLCREKKDFQFILDSSIKYLKTKAKQ